MDRIQLSQGLEALRGGSLLLTTKFPEISGTDSTDLRKKRG